MALCHDAPDNNSAPAVTLLSIHLVPRLTKPQGGSLDARSDKLHELEHCFKQQWLLFYNGDSY